MFRKELSREIIQECRKSLISIKQDLLNRARTQALSLGYAADKSGDEIDQTVAQLEEHAFLVSQERMRSQLLEIEIALSRIEKGLYGICEETEEPIEVERLLAIPWTRLSIEGAEIREAMNKKFAR